ncbi:hypothetical protein SAMN05421799_1064 [Alicyclobacillus vulcanalis]|uniref:Uncharacterized protein n=1 Tax=Alicyclobacillus vulcanalis TaxID=252246 RepID=A0A1N7MPD7_9BACL|nr:hypothetical protein SAMN05421799_1064 [Alicyclobacillus vulcanalis]
MTKVKVLGLPHHPHHLPRPVHHCGADAAHKDAIEPLPPVRANDNPIRIHCLRHIHDHVRGRAVLLAKHRTRRTGRLSVTAHLYKYETEPVNRETADRLEKLNPFGSGSKPR